jgi:hypothetical protein
MSTSRSIIIFYDDPCLDGAASMWVAYNALKEDSSANIECIPIGYGKPEERTQRILGHLHDGAEVIFLDTSPKDDTLDILFNPSEHTPKIAKLTVLDHHASEVARVKKFEASRASITTPHAQAPAFEFILDAQQPAAALLAWEYYHPNKPTPKLLEWVGLMEPPVRLKTNRDDAVAAFIDSKDISTPENILSTIDCLITLSEDEMVARGNSILADQFNNINKGIKTSLLYAKLELLPNKKEWIPLVNANVQNFGRRVNVALIEEAYAGTTCGISGAWFVQGDGIVKLSLRSKGQPDVGEVAKYLGKTIGIGGGGHPTDAVVQFENMTQFTQNVHLMTKEQMLTERWAPQPELPVGDYRAEPTKPATDPS